MFSGFKMMRSALTLLLVFLSGRVVFAADQGGGVIVGNSGDWRKIMLGQAQREAANWSNSAALNRDLFDQDPALDKSSIVYRFVTSAGSLENLAADIIASKHVYQVDASSPQGEYTACAWTNIPPNENDIIFSLSLCEPALRDAGQSFANSLVIHESVHHLLRNLQFRQNVGAVFAGTTEEQKEKEDRFCDDVALAIHRAFELVVKNGKPHWRDIATPFFNVAGKEYLFEPRGFQSTAWTGPAQDNSIKNKMIVWGGCKNGKTTIYACGGEEYFNDGAIFNHADNSWKPMSSQGSPSARAEAESIWTGDGAANDLRNLFIVWGGCRDGDGCMTRLGDGGVYDIKNDRWSPISASSSSPAPRVHHSMVWTGQEVIVWGGHPKNDNSPTLTNPVDDGGVYNLKSGTWRKIPENSPGAPSARGYHFAVWTGNTGNHSSANKMLVLGGCRQDIADMCADVFHDGAFFDPETMKWSPLVTTGERFVARHNGTFLHVPEQKRIYIFGGYDGEGNIISHGLILDLKTLRIHKMASLADGRFKHRAVWAGDKMLIFGGKSQEVSHQSPVLASTVLGYFPGAPGSSSLGEWKKYVTDEITPLKSMESSAVWTGISMIVWGGQIFDRGFTNYGSEFFTGW